MKIKNIDFFDACAAGDLTQIRHALSHLENFQWQSDSNVLRGVLAALQNKQWHVVSEIMPFVKYFAPSLLNNGFVHACKTHQDALAFHALVKPYFALQSHQFLALWILHPEASLSGRAQSVLEDASIKRLNEVAQDIDWKGVASEEICEVFRLADPETILNALTNSSLAIPLLISLSSLYHRYQWPKKNFDFESIFLKNPPIEKWKEASLEEKQKISQRFSILAAHLQKMGLEEHLSIKNAPRPLLKM